MAGQAYLTDCLLPKSNCQCTLTQKGLDEIVTILEKTSSNIVCWMTSGFLYNCFLAKYVD